MKKAIRGLAAGLLTAGLLGCWGGASVRAEPPFLKEFLAKYAKADGTADEQAYAELLNKTKCNICHMGKTKKERNAFGKAMSEFLKKGEKDKAVIAKAIDDAGAKKSVTDDDASPTFAELIAQFKLPGGDPQ